jgi:hypothetical protein
MRSLVVPFLLLCAPIPTAAAQQIIAQTSGLASPARVIDFGANLFPNFTPITTEFAGISVAHARYFTTGTSNNLVGGFLTNDFTGPPNTLSIRFAQTVSDVSFVYHQIGQQIPSTFRVLLQGVPVDSFSLLWNQSQPNNYFGFQQIAFDELQIDFDGDFNLDTLAFNPVGGAACNAFNGSNVNPASFGCVTLPILGASWQTAIAAPTGTLLTAIVFAPAGLGTPLPLFGGELLVDPSASLVAFTSPGSFALAIPPDASWVGFAMAFQGLRLELVGGSPTIVPLNAIQAVVGL